MRECEEKKKCTRLLLKLGNETTNQRDRASLIGIVVQTAQGPNNREVSCKAKPRLLCNLAHFLTYFPKRKNLLELMSYPNPSPRHQSLQRLPFGIRIPHHLTWCFREETLPSDTRPSPSFIAVITPDQEQDNKSQLLGRAEQLTFQWVPIIRIQRNRLDLAPAALDQDNPKWGRVVVCLWQFQ